MIETYASNQNKISKFGIVNVLKENLVKIIREEKLFQFIQDDNKPIRSKKRI